jgi:hypothetical protein
MKYLLIDLSVYAGLVPGLMALWYRRHLSYTLWWLTADVWLGTLLGIGAIWLASRGISNLFVYPILAVGSAITMGQLFANLTQVRWLKKGIGAIYLLYVGYVLLTGFGTTQPFMNLELFTFIDASVFGLGLFFWVSVVRKGRNLTRKPLFWLLLALWLGSLYDLAVMRIGTLVAQYAGNRWQDLFWLQINPIVTLIKLAIYTYGFYLAHLQVIPSERLPYFRP